MSGGPKRLPKYTKRECRMMSYMETEKKASNRHYQSLTKYIYSNDRTDKRSDENKLLEKTNVKKELNADSLGCSNIINDDLISRIVDEVCKRLKADKGDRQIQKGACRYRKNSRVVYIPKDPIIDQVIEVLKSNPYEPLRLTIRKVFQVAALYLKIMHEG